MENFDDRIASLKHNALKRSTRDNVRLDFADEDVTKPWVRDVFGGVTKKYPTHMPRAMLALQDMLDPDSEPTQTCPIITDAEAIDGLNKIWNINEDGTPKSV